MFKMYFYHYLIVIKQMFSLLVNSSSLLDFVELIDQQVVCTAVKNKDKPDLPNALMLKCCVAPGITVEQLILPFI